MSTKVRGWHRVARWARRGVLGSLAFVAISIAAALVVIHTPWGRNYVRAQLVSALQASFKGPVKIGRLEGSPFTTLIARDVEIDDAHGKPAVKIDRIALHVKLLGLVHKTLHLSELDLDGVTLYGRDAEDGKLNLSELLVPNESKSSATWSVVVDTVAVSHGAVDWNAGGTILHLDDVGVDGGLKIPADGPVKATLQVRGRWRERNLPVFVGGELAKDTERLDLGKVHGVLGEVAVFGREVHIRGTRIQGALFVVATARGVHALDPTIPIVGDSAISVTLMPIATSEDGRATAVLAGMSGGATFSGAAVIDPDLRHAKGALRMRGLDARQLVRGAPATAVDGIVLFDVERVKGKAGLASLEGGAHVSGMGSYKTARVDVLDVDLGFHDGAVRADLRAAAPGRTAIAVDAEVVFGAKGAIDLRAAAIRARSQHVDQASRGLIPARGAIMVDLIASGRIDGGSTALTAQGRVSGSQLVFRQYAVGRLAIDLDGTGLPTRPTGHLHVEAASVSEHGRPMIARFVGDARTRPDGRTDVTTYTEPSEGPWKFDVAAIVDTRTQGRVVVALGEHRIRTKGVDWRGSGGTVVVDQTTVIARGVSTSIAGGHVAIDGTYHRAGARTGDADAKLTLTHLDLAEVDRSLGLGGRWHGIAEGEVAAARHGGLITAKIDARGRDLVAQQGAPPIDLELKADLAPGKVDVSGRASGATVGAVSFAVDVEAPRHLDDRRAWIRLARSSIHGGQIVADHVQLAQAARLFGICDVKAGRLDGTYTLSAGGITGTMNAVGVEGQGLPSPLDATLALSSDAGSITIDLDAVERRMAKAKATVKLALPPRPFDPIEWADTDPDDFYGAHVRIDGDLRDQELSRRLGLIAPWRGVGSVDIDIAPELAKGTVLARVTQLTGGPIVEPIDSEVAMTIDHAGIAGRLTTVLEKRPLMTADFGTTTPPRDLVRTLQSGDQAAIDALPLRLQVTIERMPVAAVMRALGRGGQKLEGTASLSIAVGGTIGDPQAKATAALADLGTAKVTMRQLLAEATYRGRAIELKVNGNEDSGGTLALVAKGSLDHLDTATATIKSKKFDLTPLGRMLPPSIGVGGVLDADLQLTGNDLATGRMGGHAHLTDGLVPLHPLVGTLHKATVDLAIGPDSIAVSAQGLVGLGSLDLHLQAGMKGLMPTAGSADVTINHVTLINEAQPRLDGIAHIDITQDAGLWKLAVDMRRVFVTLPEDKGLKLHPPGVPGDIVFIENGKPPPADTAPPPRRSAVIGRRPYKPFLIATIDLGQVRVESNELRGLVMGKLTLTVGDDAIAIDGAIDAGRAEIALSDRRYQVDHASVRFDGSADPFVDIRLQHDFNEVTLYVVVRGRLSHPDLRLSSDPGTYSQSELLGFLMGGEPGAAPAHGVQDVASGIASSFFSNRVRGYAKAYIGISFDVLKFEAGTSSSSAALTIGKWISAKLFVQYRQRVDGRFDENSSEAELEYWLGRSVVVDGTAGDRGVDGVDLIWTKRW